MTLFEFKKNTKATLNSVSPQLDVEVLLEHFTGFNKTKQLLNREWNIPEDILFKLNEAVEKRNTGLPVAYITNKKEFYGYDFYVNQSVLIPKPDTEILVEKAIDSIYGKMESRNKGGGNEGAILSICDMCTGSGCIGISVMKQLIEEYKVPFGKLPVLTLVDISSDALDIARYNAEKLLGAKAGSDIRTKLRFIQSNLFDLVNNQFDVILTNPPYVPSLMVDELLKDGRSEPRLALDGDVTEAGEKASSLDGLELIRRLIPQAKKHLSPLGIILMETGEYNAESTARFAEELEFKTEIHKDLEGQLRVVEMK